MAKRSTMNISLPVATRRWVEEQVKMGEFSSASEFFRHLARTEQRRQEDRLEQLLLEGMRGPGRELTDADWAAMRTRIRARAAKRRKRAG